MAAGLLSVPLTGLLYGCSPDSPAPESPPTSSGGPAPAAPDAPGGVPSPGVPDAAGAPGAGGEAGGAGAPEGGAPAVAYDPSFATATIVVRVRTRGSLPKLGSLDFSMCPECAAKHAAPVADDSIRVKDGRPANVVAWVSKGADRWTFKAPEEAVMTEMKEGLFVPRFVTFQTGQPLRVSNMEHGTVRVRAEPTANPPLNTEVFKGETLETKFEAEEQCIGLRCDGHPWLTAWAGVFAHPFHGITGEDGTVKLKVPPGDFEVSVWHEYEKFARPTAKPVLLAEGESRNLEFILEVK